MATPKTDAILEHVVQIVKSGDSAAHFMHVFPAILAMLSTHARAQEEQLNESMTLNRDALKTLEETKNLLFAYKSSRIAYASEFMLTPDGEPDVDNIHRNIRKMKTELEGLKWQVPDFVWYWFQALVMVATFVIALGVLSGIGWILIWLATHNHIYWLIFLGVFLFTMVLACALQAADNESDSYTIE